MSEIHKISIALTSEQIGTLKSAVDVGQYATISEVIREAVRDWQRKHKKFLSGIKRRKRCAKKHAPGDKPRSRLTRNTTPAH